VLSLGIVCLRIAAVEQPFTAIAYTLAGALKGAGDTKGPFMAWFAGSVLIRLPLVYLAVYRFDLGITHVWWITALQFFVVMVLMVRRYRRTQWSRIAHKPSFNSVEL
jgi:Na+-driven multidrug efflux pump